MRKYTEGEVQERSDLRISSMWASSEWTDDVDPASIQEFGGPHDTFAQAAAYAAARTKDRSLAFVVIEEQQVERLGGRQVEQWEAVDEIHVDRIDLPEPPELAAS